MLEYKIKLMKEEFFKKISEQNSIIQQFEKEVSFLRQENTILKTKIQKFSKVDESNPSKKRKVENKIEAKIIFNDSNYLNGLSLIKSEDFDFLNEKETFNVDSLLKNVTQEKETFNNETKEEEEEQSEVSNAIFNILKQKSPEQTISVRAIKILENILGNIDEMMTNHSIQKLEKGNEKFEEEEINKMLRSLLPENLANKAINYATRICKNEE
jgi:BMFP domain-containing protein YqiC